MAKIDVEKLKAEPKELNWNPEKENPALCVVSL